MADPDFNPRRNIVLPDAKKQPDRALAIVLAAVVEDDLLKAINARLIENKKLIIKMFTNMGPLATFSAKIELGVLLGLYRSDFANMLHSLRKVRNAFAHNMNPLTLESEEIKRKAAGFNLLDRLDRQIRRKRSERERFIGACDFMMGALIACADRSSGSKSRR